MARAATQLKDRDESAEFASLLGENFRASDTFEGQVVKGIVIAKTNDFAIVDVGLKAEGRVPLKEFSVRGAEADLDIGQEVEVYVERIENKQGEAVLSREKAKREEAWSELERAHSENEEVTGVIFARVKGGYTVDLKGATAFLPGSQVDLRPTKDSQPPMNEEVPLAILKMDRARGNIVVSRRALMEDDAAGSLDEVLANINEGDTMEGVVKNITDYGAFIDLGGIDGLVHVTDISWKRVNHPSEVMTVGDTVKVQVTKVNAESKRVSLGMKQLENDPWDDIVGNYPSGKRVKGKVTNIADYGAFVEIEEGVEGLVHVSEMSWTKKNLHPSKILNVNDEIEVMVLDVDMDKRRISLGLKQCEDSPWAAFAAKNPEGTIIEGEVKNITDFGLFISLPEVDIDGMVHMSDIDASMSGEEALAGFSEGDKVKAKVLEINPEKERISLGIKQLDEKGGSSSSGAARSTGGASLDGMKKGDVVTCTVSEITDGGVAVTVNDKTAGFIKRAELSRERSEQRPDRFAVGEKVDAKIVMVEKKKGSLQLSIKQLQIEEDKKALAEYGSSDSGASLGDILGAALDSAKDDGTPAKAKKAPAKKAAAKKPAAKKAPAKKDEDKK